MSKGREVISVHIGQAGCQMATTIWEQYCKEHRIDLDGTLKSRRIRGFERVRINKDKEFERVEEEKNEKEKENEKTEQSPANKRSEVVEATVFFQHITKNDKFVPRSVLVDLEPNVIDEIKASSFGALFNSNMLVNGKEDAANNYARGHYTIGQSIAPLVMEGIRKQVEASDHCQGFLFNYAVGGGTGSGLGGLLQKEIKSIYSKVPQISFAVYPSLLLSTCVVEPYNALLATYGMIEYNDITVVLDNEAGYDLTTQNLLKYSSNPQARASYYNINALVCKVISSVTCGLRFVGEQQSTISDMQTNLVPFPRLHFMTCSLTPIVSESNKEYTPWNEEDITLRSFEKEYMFVKYHDWDVQEDQYCGISLIYRGNANITAINAAIQKAKSSRLRLVEWCPTGFKTSLIDRGLSVLTDDGMMATDKSLTMIGNNTAIVRPMEQRIGRKFDLMYSQRAFVHWYVGEGMEEGEFAEAREDLGLLVKDYTDLKTNHPSDDENSNGDPADGDDTNQPTE